MGRTHKWSDFRANILDRDNHRCTRCGQTQSFKQKTYYGISFTDNLIVDHILPLKLGGEEFNPDNCQTLCSWCNKKKNAWDQSLIAKSKRLEVVDGQ